MVQNQRLKSLKTLQDQYMKSVNDLSKIHREQQLNINAELRKDLSNLQKKMMDDAVIINLSIFFYMLITMLITILSYCLLVKLIFFAVQLFLTF